MDLDIAELNLRFLQKINSNEYRSECPKCGGHIHENGEYPDRFIIWVRSKTTGAPLGYCRGCKYIWVPKSHIDHYASIKNDVVNEIKADNAAKVEVSLQKLNDGRVWEKYHDNLNDITRQYYYNRLIEDYWIEYWQLGYNPSKTIYDKIGEYSTPTMTIPVFKDSNTVLTIRNRLLQPRKPTDKYRPEFSNLPTGLFLTDYERKPVGKALIVEGEFKAMTTYIAIGDPELYVVGIPGKNPNEEIFEKLSQCEPVYLLLDPDTYSGKDKSLLRVKNYFGSRARIIKTPGKIDDMILANEIKTTDILTMMKLATRDL